MATGYAHIFALPSAVVDSGRTSIPQFQFTFNGGEIAYAKVLEGEEGLREFLLDELGFRADVVDDALSILRAEGKTTIPDVAISEHDAAVMGLMEVAVDY